MPEYRLAKVAGELNRSAKDLAEYLNSKGFSVDAKPTTKISEEMHRLLLEEFSADKAAKDEANQLKSMREKVVTPPPAAKPPVAKTTTKKEVTEPPAPKEKPAPK